MRDNSAAFDRRHDLARGANLPPYPNRRVFRDRIDIAVESDRDEHVVTPGLVNQGRVRPLRLQHIDDGGQFVVFDDDLGGDILGLGAGIGDTGGDQFADVAESFR